VTTKINLFSVLTTLALVVGCNSADNSAFIPQGVAGGGVGGGTGGGAGGGGAGGGTGVEPLLIFGPNENNSIGKLFLSGDARRISYLDAADPLGTNPGPGTSWEVWSYDLAQNVPVQLTPGSSNDIFPSTVLDATDNGDFVVFITTDDFTGSNPNNRNNVFRAAADGSAISQMTDFSGQGSASEVVISGDGSLIAFVTDNDLTGGNPGLSPQIFTIDSAGNNAAQITNGNFAPSQIAVSDNGALIAFQSTSDPFATNPDNSREIFIVNTDGSNLTQLTMETEDSWGPQLSDDGSLVAFVSSGDHVPGGNTDMSVEIFVGRTNGGGFTQISDSAVDSGGICCSVPGLSISGDGNYVAFTSAADFTGDNPGLDFTIFWASSSGGAVAQLLRPGTVPDSVTSFSADRPSLNNNGSTIAFRSARNFTSDPGNTNANNSIYTAARL